MDDFDARPFVAAVATPDVFGAAIRSTAAGTSVAPSRRGVVVKVAFLFSGQASAEHVELLHAVFGGGATVVVSGALDGLRREEIRRLAPRDGEPRTITELADGESVVVDKLVLGARLQEKAEAVAADGASLVVLLSTGEYPGLAPTVPCLLPSRLFDAVVRTTLPPGSRLGVIVPLEEQIADVRGQWERLGYEVAFAAASPWSDAAELDAAVRRLAPAGPRLVVMDCFAYTPEHKQVVQRHLETLVVLPRDVLVPLALGLLS
jgi:protein AroM